jgi:glycosyltransferase involved in cell wall biosynthesis
MGTGQGTPSPEAAARDAEDRPLVSVIMPCYNAERYLREALDSLLGQTYKPLEIVVVDDGSRDGSAAILDTYRDRVTVLRQENAGAGAARYTGVRYKRGSFVAFCDADDLWMPHKLERQMRVFARYPEVGVVACAMERIDAAGRRLPSEGNPNLHLEGRPVDLQSVLLTRGNMIGLSTAVVRREVVDWLAGFSPYRVSQDYDFWIRASDVTKFFLVPEPLVLYRELANSLLHGTLWKEYRPQFHWLRVHRARYDAASYRKRRSVIYRDWADSALHRGDRDGFRLLRKAIRLDPRNGAFWAALFWEAVKWRLRGAHRR